MATMNAIVKRINRKLKQDNKILRKARTERARMEVGEYYILDFNRNFVTTYHVDPESLARELGCMQSNETVE